MRSSEPRGWSSDPSPVPLVAFCSQQPRTFGLAIAWATPLAFLQQVSSLGRAHGFFRTGLSRKCQSLRFDAMFDKDALSWHSALQPYHSLPPPLWFFLTWNF
ncbi:hypothetical protein BO94DRAFT_359252 [Aspergillus sclerotioniger CBS 115572]|uniref:Uncharacterized protein n=1 Tax=Aspergillus sclerotioniger CBS 115572 TaxID=1450535 RepID=A0A317X386_9EURO|nr:hypothetical protein BO94DRAFT_359252 [Aspergillus sclerotioniger CBS 115572]PWY93094.1 hypothetical protein BO94DRAFT_359252 [Aspergillus sclerotioniger CBS 115572]